jgi:hypothetical protein
MTRPYRYAALIIGAPADEVASKASADVVRRTDRGVVILGDETVATNYHDEPNLTIFEVWHYLDHDEFELARHNGTKTEMYTLPFRASPFKLRRIEDVEGEKQPRAILRKLGIPEDFLYPK